MDVLRPALALGALAALPGAAGVALAPALGRLSPRVRHGLVATGLTAGIVPVVVAWVVMMAVSVGAGLAGLLSALTRLAAATYGPYWAGRWIGQGWWVLACLVIPIALVWFWAPPYVDAVPRLSRDGWIMELLLPVYDTVAAAIAAGLAAVGALQNRPTGLPSPRSGPVRRF